MKKKPITKEPIPKKEVAPKKEIKTTILTADEFDEIFLKEKISKVCSHPGRLQTLYDSTTKKYTTKCHKCGAPVIV